MKLKNADNRLTQHPWNLVALGIILLSAHGLVFYFVRHLALSATIASGILVLAVIKHVGTFSSLYALLRRRARKVKEPPS
jgi:hypothetical protein